ncbi:hypothetical protein BKA70DRAFT_1556091 [Coprinopsis sp. MPI-PUGE-AT-0042]|nr:hypothetical protein BKA70DRAFT_1556091 [Coprinopsis sp. MPI-PUGE-AT-0042]
MSEHTISRWNAIPMTREAEPPGQPSSTLKRSRPEDDDDDISIASRTPSPPPDGMAMDVDKYDEYVRKPVREVITVETRIKPENKGFALLAKMGWAEGQPLGLSEDGRVDPIPFQMKNDATGIGKFTRDVEMIETTVSQRRGLDSERQQKETEDQRRAREEIAARKAAVSTEISETLRAFYCTYCDKQFKNVAQYDEHTNSYAHHHKVRMKDMQANARPVLQEDVDKRKEKERKREEKELRKIAKAAGIKMPKTTTTATAPTTGVLPVASSSTAPSGFAPVSEPSAEPKNAVGGWATVSNAVPSLPATATDSSAQPSGGGFKKSGWATVGAAPSSSSLSQATASSGGWSKPSTSGTQTPNTQPSSMGGFRTGGWTSLDSGATSSAPPAPPPAGWQPVASSPAPSPAQPTPQETTAPSQPVRSGWQQFNAMKGRGRR